MAQQIIDVGNVANDGTGDPLRTAFQIVNENFYEVFAPSSNIANGSSRIDIAQDGDIYMTSNGVANVMVVSTTEISMGVPDLGNAMQVTIYGNLAVTGNAILSGNILGDRIENGTTIVDIQSPGGNANISIGGITNVAVFAPTGEYIDGLLSVSGNITNSGNISSGGNIVSSGNIVNNNFILGPYTRGGYSTSEIRGTSSNSFNIVPTSGYDVNHIVSGGGLASLYWTSNIANALPGVGNDEYVSAIVNNNGFNISSNSGASLSWDTNNGNVYMNGGNLLLLNGQISTPGNIVGGNISTSGALSVASFVSTGNITGGNLLTSGIVSATGNATFGNLVIGSGSTGNAIIYGNLTVYGNTTTIESNTITTNDLNITVGNNQNTGVALNNAGIDVGNNNLATWRFNNSTTSWQSNIAITPSSNATLALGGPSNYWGTAYLTTASVSGAVSGGTITTSGNIVAGNISTNGVISASGNITGGNIIATNIGNVAALNFDGNISNVLLGSGVFGNTPASLGALNYVQNSVSSSQTVYTSNTFPYTVVSASITTNGKPVQVIVSGDANPLTAGGFGVMQLYRNSTAIGQPVQYESSAANENVPYALQVIDVPPSFGTYTYALKVNSLTANTQFGEAGGPVLSAIEIQNVKGDDGAPYAWRTIAANGTNIISNVSEATITYTPGNNIIITGNATSNVVTFAVSQSPTFTGNVTGGNLIGNLVGNLVSTTASVTANATIGNANIGAYTTNALRVNGTGYIINSATADPYPNTGTLDIAAVTRPNVVIRGFSQTTSNTSGPVLQFIRKQQTGINLNAGYDAGRIKFGAIEPNNDMYNYVGEIAGIAAGDGTDGQLEFYSGLGNVPQLALTLDSYATAIFSGNIIPSANVTYSLGNSTNWWSTAYFGASTLYVGGVAVGTSGNTLTVAGNNVVTANATGTSTTTGNLSITGNITAGGLVGTLYTNNIVNTGGNATGNIGSASTYFNTVFAKSTSAQYADLAEKYLADKKYEPGTVLSFGGSAEVTQSSEDSDRRIIGVVSSKPAYIMNSGLGGEFAVDVALQGRVSCLVQGPVQRGDMLVSAGNGRARAEQDPRVGSVIGKSLQDFDGEYGTIEVVVGRI